MGKNLIPEIAKLLGVEIGEKFKLHPVGCDKTSDKYYNFSVALNEQCGVISCRKNGVEIPQPDFLFGLIMGYYEIVKLPWEPQYGEVYYWPSTIRQEVRIEWFNWRGDAFDLAMKALGMVYKTKKEALEHFAEDYERLTGKPLSEGVDHGRRKEKADK